MTTTCKHDGCDRPVRSRGWCKLHYEYFRKGYESHREAARSHLARYFAKRRLDPSFYERERERKKEWVRRYPEKRAAHKAVYRAIRKGILVRPTACANCGQVGNVQAHHADYSKPLEVEWLCSRCHGRKERRPDLAAQSSQEGQDDG